MIEIIPNWHPIWVHFAIALLATGSAIYLIFGWRTDPGSLVPEHPLVVARWMLWLGAAASLAALLTGYWASNSVAHDDLGHANMMVHRNWAITATTLFAIVAGWELKRRVAVRASVLSTLLIVVGSVALLVTGFEGAENVYEHGLGVKRLPAVSSHEHAHSESTDDGNSTEAVADDGHTHDHTTPGTQPERPVDEVASDHPAARVAQDLSRAISLGDVDELKLILDPGVIIFESGNVELSLAEYESHHMKSDMAFMASMNVELLSREVIDSGDTATVISRSRIFGRYKDKDLELVNTETLVIIKQDETWKVRHIHWSSSRGRK